LVEFWDCPSDTKELSVYSRERTLYRVYTRELNRELCTGFVYDMKKFNLIPLSPSKVSWDFSKKEECNNIIKNWQMTFQTSDLRGNQFLELLDDELHLIVPSYIKGGPWIRHFGHSNLLCARASRAIV